MFRGGPSSSQHCAAWTWVWGPRLYEGCFPCPCLCPTPGPNVLLPRTHHKIKKWGDCIITWAGESSPMILKIGLALQGQTMGLPVPPTPARPFDSWPNTNLFSDDDQNPHQELTSQRSSAQEASRCPGTPDNASPHLSSINICIRFATVGLFLLPQKREERYNSRHFPEHYFISS